jgi:hypothetical protein
MTNAQKFQETFGIYATEMWAMPEHDFLKWLNADTPQTESYYTDATHFGKAKGESTTTNTADIPHTDCGWGEPNE